MQSHLDHLHDPIADSPDTLPPDSKLTKTDFPHHAHVKKPNSQYSQHPLLGVDSPIAAIILECCSSMVIL